MFDIDINNPNEFVPEGTLPPSAIGRSGMGALAVAGHGSPQQPKLLGGLQGGKTQADLENIMFSRVRSKDDLDIAEAARREQLSKLQGALSMETDGFNGIEHIARGIVGNDRPWDVGNGFRKGVASAMDAKQSKLKEAKESAILSAKVGLDFEKGEGDNDDELETNALSNLRMLAKPLLARGGAAGNGLGGGVRFKSVPGVGLIDTHSVDEETGAPKIVFKDNKMLVDARMQARKLAEKEAESENHRILFKDTGEKESFIERRTEQIIESMINGTDNKPDTPAQPLAIGTPAAVVPAGKGAMGFPAGTQLPAATNTGTSRLEVLSTELADAKAKGRTADVEILEREISNLPKSERGALPVPGVKAPVYPVETPDVQAGKTKTAEKLAEQHVEAVGKMKSDAQVGMNIVNTVGELRQLKFNPGMFAKWKQRGGNLLEALGKDGWLVQSAAQSGNAEALLQGLSNARITLEKGVQTRDDEARFKREIANITDPKQGYEYMLKHMEEIGKKSVEQYNTYENFRKQSGGTSYDGADQVWQKRNSEYGGLVKRYQGSFIGRSQFIDSIVSDPNNVKAYNGDAEKLRERAEREWRSLGGK